MILKFIPVLLTVWVLVFGAPAMKGQIESQETMYLVQVDVKTAEDIALCYTTRFDLKKVKIMYSVEDSINNLDDFIYEEDPLVGPECFIPELKLLFRDHTYVISLHCSKVIKFANTAPHVPSSQRLKNDLIVTQSMIDYLNRLRVANFGNEIPSQGLLAKVVTSEPFDELSDEDDIMKLLLEEDFEEIDTELEMEAGDVDKMILEEEEDVDVLEEEIEGLDDGR
ncbi:MAG: hypothetical protein SF052_27565 [Bacteroidia bacterium]|nr:hypothetical protein [Bacteroidia bacterium]